MEDALGLEVSVTDSNRSEVKDIYKQNNAPPVSTYVNTPVSYVVSTDDLVTDISTSYEAHNPSSAASRVPTTVALQVHWSNTLIPRILEH